MRKVFIPLVLVAALSAPAMALAATQSVDGTIKSIDAKAMTVTLNNGVTYKTPATLKLASFKVGEKVKVQWNQVGKTFEATAITAVN